MKLPKNIKTMTDTERWAWWKALPRKQRDEMSERTFQGTPEWFVYWYDKDGGDLEGPNIHDDEKSAVAEFDLLIKNPTTLAARVEKVVGTYDIPEADLGERKYTEIRTFGKFPD